MKKVFLFLVVILLIVGCKLNAATKQDILDFVNSQHVGDTKTSAVFNSYKTTFTRLLKQKYLTEEQCDKVLSYLTSSVNTLNSKGVTKISDLKNLTDEELNSIYNALSAGASIITNAPALDETTNDGGTTSGANGDKKSNTVDSKTTVSIDASDGTMEIYENGVLIDKISSENNKFTYTGPSKFKINVIIFSAVVLVISIELYVFLSKRKKTKTNMLFKDILISCIFCFSIVILVIVIFHNWISKIETVISTLKYNSSEETINIELDADKTIKKYPSYGNNYARLIIKSLDINQSIVYGDDTNLLNNNIGQATWSSFPTEGDLTVLSGHNKDNMLLNIKDISVGEEILIDTSYAVCRYAVNKINVVSDTDYEALTKNTDKETLILYTCYPFSQLVYGSKRFVVYANLEEIQWK